ncbi:hypothetical protein D3C85_611950 [compost metagenome]
MCGAQRANHEEITVAITQVQRRQIRVIDQRLAEGPEQRQALLQVRRLDRRVDDQQAQQVTNRFVGGLQVEADILLDAIEQFLAAGQDDLCGLPITENAQYYPGQQQQEGKHHADMNVQGKSPLIRTQWAGHAGRSVMVNTLLSVQA